MQLQKQQTQGGSKSDEKLMQTMTLTQKRLDVYLQVCSDDKKGLKIDSLMYTVS